MATKRPLGHFSSRSNSSIIFRVAVRTNSARLALKHYTCRGRIRYVVRGVEHYFPFCRDRSNSKSRSTLTAARQNAAQLMYLRFAELGLEKESILYTRVGIPMYDLNLLIHNPSEYTSNANLMRNPETIAKLVHDQVMEQHTYLSIPTHLADAHMKGDIYIKDREYFSTRDYCATWDLRQILLLGIAPDGLGGMHSSAAGPAQHLPVAVNHAAI